jgi:hypothetical protein
MLEDENFRKKFLAKTEFHKNMSQLALFVAYHKFGHPWSRLLKAELKKAKAAIGTTVSLAEILDETHL